MAIIKASKGGKTLSRAINYAAKDEIVSGINCPDDPRLACEQMNSTKEVWDKEDGRLYKPYVQSFAPGEVTPDQAHQVGREFAEKAFPGYEIIVGTHTESKSGVIHNHFVINSVNFEDGHKIQTDKKDLERFKSISDEICLKHGLSIVDRDKSREKGTVVAWDRDKYQIITKALEGKGKSHLVDIAKAVNKALLETEGKGMKAFQDNLKDQRITYYERSDKAITFVAEGGKATGATLAKTFSNPDFNKANILALVKVKDINKEQVAEVKSKPIIDPHIVEQNKEIRSLKVETKDLKQDRQDIYNKTEYKEMSRADLAIYAKSKQKECSVIIDKLEKIHTALKQERTDLLKSTIKQATEQYYSKDVAALKDRQTKLSQERVSLEKEIKVHQENEPKGWFVSKSTQEAWDNKDDSLETRKKIFNAEYKSIESETKQIESKIAKSCEFENEDNQTQIKINNIAKDLFFKANPTRTEDLKGIDRKTSEVMKAQDAIRKESQRFSKIANPPYKNRMDKVKVPITSRPEPVTKNVLKALDDFAKVTAISLHVPPSKDNEDIDWYMLTPEQIESEIARLQEKSQDRGR